MNYFSIDYLIVYAFLVITLIIGIRAGRGIQNIREYAIANKTFGTGALVLSYLATNIAGATIFNGTAYMFSQGIIVVIALFGLVIAFIIRAIFIAPKMAHFKDCLTMGDLMETFYGKGSKIIAGVLGSLTAICLAGMELILLGFISQNLLGIKAEWIILTGGILLAAYSAYGGIKSVTATDVFQFLVFIVVFPGIAYIILNKAGGIQEVFTHVPADKFKVLSHPNFSLYLTLFLIWSIFPAGMMDPAIIQRMLMAQNGKQLRDQYLVIAAFDPAFQIVLLSISFSALVLYPNLEGQQVIPHIIQVLLPTGIKGIAIAGLLAITISSIDSYLHAAGLTFTHDVIKPLTEKRYAINELTIVRYVTVAISLVAIIIAMKTTNTFALLLNSLAFTGPLLMFPFLSGIMGLKTDKQSFYLALSITLITFMLTKILLPPGYSHLTSLISILGNGISFFSVHLIKNKRFARIHQVKENHTLWRPKSKNIGTIIKGILPTPKHIIQYSQNKVVHYSAPYILFGVFFTINYIAPYFLWATTPIQYNQLMINCRLIGGILCGLLIIQEKWPNTLRAYLPTFWHLTILYCLPFTSTLMFLITEGTTEWLVNIIAIIILLFILLDWVTAVIIGILGISLGMLFYQLIIGDLSNIHLPFITKYLLIYQGVFGLLIGLIFARRKQLAFNRVTTQRDYLKHTQQDINTRLVETFNYREGLLRELDNQEIIHLDEVTANYIKQSIYRITDYLRLHVTTISINDFLEKVSKIPQLQESVSQPELYIQNFSRVKEIQADEDKLYEVLVNSIGYLQSLNSAGKPIKLALEDTLIGHAIAHIKDYTRKLNALKITITTEENLPAKQDIYTIDTSKPSTWLHHEHTIKEATLVENAQIVDAHYGYMDIQSTHTHTYVIPVKLREIRGKVMELLREPAAADPDELKHPTAIQLEKELWDKLKGTNIDRTVIEKALATIKKYHGGVKRRSGEPFFTHPINVALILLDQIQDQDATLGALLHDTVEDTSLTLTQIQGLFGETVAFIVGKVTNLEDNLRRISLDDHENLQRLMNYEDERVALVKLSDRLHNMRTIQFHPSLSKQKNIANETLAFFVPMAKQLGKMAMANELESLSLEVMSKKEIN